MINISGSVSRSFIFPSDFDTAFDFYSNLQRTFSFLDHISILEQYSPGEYRMLYHATELGIYHVRVFCDIQTETDRRSGVLQITPLESYPPIASKAGLYSLSSQGIYSSESIFSIQAEGTEIKYKLSMHASLPVPLGLRFMPVGVINEIGAISPNGGSMKLSQVLSNALRVRTTYQPNSYW